MAIIDKFNLSQTKEGWRWGGEVWVRDFITLELYTRSPDGRHQAITLDVYTADAERLRNDLTEAIKVSKGESSERVKDGRNSGRAFCPHPDRECLNGCYRCGFRLLINDHDHIVTRGGTKEQPQYECACATCA